MLITSMQGADCGLPVAWLDRGGRDGSGQGFEAAPSKAASWDPQAFEGSATATPAPLPGLTAVVCSGSPAAPAGIAQAYEMSGPRLAQGYGTTERPTA